MATKKVEKKAVKKVVKKVVEKAEKKAEGACPRRARAPALPTACPARAGETPALPVASAKNCPLVLDGEMDAADFKPRACLTCDEFDCRFCEAAEGSGALRSRLFMEDEDGAGDGWDCEDDFEGGGGDGDEEDMDEQEDESGF